MSCRVVYLLILPVIVLAFLASGCSTGASSRDEMLSRLMEDMDTGRSASSSAYSPVHERSVRKAYGSASDVKYRGSDNPDRPAMGLPSLDSVRKDYGSEISAGEPVEGENVATGHEPGKESKRRTAAFGLSGLTIQADSIVQVSVEEDTSLDGSYPVNEIGAIELGYIGPVILLNKSEAEAAAKIREVLVAREFRKASVSVKILRASYDKVQITGAVAAPGLIRIGAGDNISLNNALLRAGGLQASAKGAKIRIIRDGLLSAVGQELQGEEYSLVDADGKPSVPSVMLDNNDVARVFSSEVKASVMGGDKEVLVIGEVSRPGVYRFAGGEPCTIMHLIFKMGGLPPYANKKQITIKRVSDDGFEENIEVDAEKILKEGNPEDDVSLFNGDRVIIPARRLSLF